jgi:hypothetical protein
MRPQLILKDGQLIRSTGEVLSTPFFSDVEEAKRWLEENKINAEVENGSASL